jgi:hypothetical protein
MPDIGYTSPAGDGEQSAITLRGNRITMSEDGSAGVTLSFRIFDNASTAGDSVKACIFNASTDALIAESAVRTDITTEALYTFSGGGLSSFTPANGVSYFICVLANSSTIRSVFDDIAAPGGVQVTDQDASTFGPPAAFSGFGSFLNDARSTIGHMTYTSSGGGGGGAPRFAGFQMMMRNN